MSTIAVAVKHLIAAGISGDALVQAIAEMEAAQSTSTPRTARQERNARYYQNRKGEASENRLNKTDSDVSDAPSDKEKSPTPPKEINSPSNPPSPPKGGSSPVEEAIFIYSENAAKAGLAVPRSITADRRRKIEVRLKEHGLAAWQEACEKMARSSFCRGQNDRGWRADLDFLLQPKSFNGLLEGRYDGRSHSRGYQHIDGRI